MTYEELRDELARWLYGQFSLGVSRHTWEKQNDRTRATYTNAADALLSGPLRPLLADNEKLRGYRDSHGSLADAVDAYYERELATLKARVERLEGALREITRYSSGWPGLAKIVSDALSPEAES